MQKLGVGVIGCGVISEIYLKNMTERFPVLNVRGVADTLPEKARLRSEQYSVPFFQTPGDLLASSAIDIVVNLTAAVWPLSGCQRSVACGQACVFGKADGDKPVPGRRASCACPAARASAWRCAGYIPWQRPPGVPPRAGQRQDWRCGQCGRFFLLPW